MSTNIWNNVKLTEAKKLYTGPAKVTVVGINPTPEEISEILGIPADKINEPDYSEKLVVYLKGVDNNFIAKGTFWTKTEDVPESQTGKIKYLNNEHQSAYLTNPDDSDELSWFSRDGLRRAQSGEEELYQFLINWIGIDVRAAKFEIPFESIADGDITVLKEALAQFGSGTANEKSFVALLGVADGKYQEFCPKIFGRTFAKNFSKVQWNREFTTEFTEYVPKTAPDPLESESEKDVDLPF